MKITTLKQSFKSKEDLEEFACMCYGFKTTEDKWGNLNNLERSRLEKYLNKIRIDQETDVFSHENMCLLIEGLPYALAIILMIEKNYNLILSDEDINVDALSQKEKMLYIKWTDIFKNKLQKKERDLSNAYSLGIRLESLSKEYAKYITSVFAPKNAIITLTAKDLYDLIKKLNFLAEKSNKTEFELALMPYLKEFVDNLKSLSMYDDAMASGLKKIDLFSDGKVEEYFGDVYSTSYRGSFVEFVDSLQFDNIRYFIKVYDSCYIIPSILNESEDLANLWVDDLKSIADLFPLASMLEINEVGTIEDYKDKYKKLDKNEDSEMLDINKKIFDKYEHALRVKNHPLVESFASIK